MPAKHQVTADPEWARLPSLQLFFRQAFDLRLYGFISVTSAIRQQIPKNEPKHTAHLPRDRGVYA